MKKYIIAVAVGVFLIISPVKADTLQDQYQATLVQLITLLQQQVVSLMAQLQALQTSQTQIQTQVTQIQQTVTPSFGSTNPNQNAIIPTMETDKSAIVATVLNNHSEQGLPFGMWYIKVVVLDKNGKNVKGATVDMTAPDQFSGLDNKQNSERQTLTISGNLGEGTVIMDDWYTSDFSYAPTSIGEKILTFTSGNLSTNVSIEVK